MINSDLRNDANARGKVLHYLRQSSNTADKRAFSSPFNCSH